jgi:serine/threonine protein phosphatase PrpC
MTAGPLRVLEEGLVPASGETTLGLALLSRPGGRDHNEDACGYWHGDRYLCCVVADGAGGHGGGDVAARLAVSHIIEHYAAAPGCEPPAIHALLAQTNAVVIAHRQDSPALAHMHTTVIGLFVDLEQARAVWGHAGDSRLYLFRGGRIVLRTQDHSLVQSLVDAGMLTADQMRTHPRRSELRSALGTEPEDLMLTVTAEACALQAGDVILLCTDGLWEYIDDSDLSLSLARAVDPGAWLAELEQLVLAAAHQAGKTRHDNFSAVAVWARANPIISVHS